MNSDITGAAVKNKIKQNKISQIIDKYSSVKKKREKEYCFLFLLELEK